MQLKVIERSRSEAGKLKKVFYADILPGVDLPTGDNSWYGVLGVTGIDSNLNIGVDTGVLANSKKNQNKIYKHSVQSSLCDHKQKPNTTYWVIFPIHENSQLLSISQII